jgi:hypothetical protein
VDIAVHFEVMEEWHENYKGLFNKAFKSFKKVKREAVAEADASGEASGEPMTREEYIDRKTADLPEGWWAKTTKAHLLISHAEKKYTEKIGKFSDAIRKQIERELAIKKSKSDKKKDVYVPIIRICNSPGEYNAYVDTSEMIYNPKTREVVVYDGSKQGYDIEWTFSRIGSGIFSQYINDEFMLAQPHAWFTSGMAYYYMCFKSKGSGCKYVHDHRVVTELREAEKRGECKSLKALLSPKSKGIQGAADWWKVGNLICFLRSREGNRKPWKGLLDRYLENFRNAYEDVNTAIEEEIEKAKEEIAKAESEEEGKKKGEKVSSRWKDFDEKVRKRAYEDTFAGWEDGDWDKLEKAYMDWVM